MAGPFATDEELIARLPLPLAQLYRRARNSKTPLDRHLTSYYLWEASLKLLGSVAIRVPGETLTWNTADLQITSSMRANALLTKSYRKGWEPSWGS